MKPADRRRALVGATVHRGPESEALRNGVVLIADGMIIAVGGPELSVPADFEVIDVTGLTITAGFWNSHVHFFERKWANAASIPAAELTRQLREMIARYGFTSVFDLSSEWENTRRLRDRIESGEVDGPHIRSTGEGLIPPCGMPPDLVSNMMGAMKIPLPEVGDPAQAAAAARRLLDAGVDGIKLFASAPRSEPLTEQIFAAAAHEAHDAGKPVFVHPNSGADVLTAVRGGADVVAHTTPHSGPWSDEILGAMRERDVALTPTLTLWKYFARHDRVSAQDRIVETEVGQLQAWRDRGGSVLFGTDLGAVEYDPSEEYELMAAAGMSFREILASLTTAPAERFGDGARLGRVDPGYQADLAILRGDPVRDLRALTAVEWTMRAGESLFNARDNHSR